MRTALVVRRLVRTFCAIGVLVALAGFVVEGGVARGGPLFVLALVAWLVVFAKRVRTRLALVGDAPFTLDFQLGALLAIAVDAVLLRADGTLAGPLSPTRYVLIALVTAFGRAPAALAVVGWVIGLDAIAEMRASGLVKLDALAIRAAFGSSFAVLNVFVLRSEVARVRKSARAAIDRELERLRADARSFRLLGPNDSAAPDRVEERMARSSVEEIHQSVHYALELLRSSLELHTAVLLWRTESGTHLRISELATGSDAVRDAPFAVGEGVLAAAVSNREPVLLENLRSSHRVPYYQGGCPVRTLLAIPVVDDKTVRGVLALDRLEPRSFSPQEQETAAQAARYCLRAIENERVFVQLERAKVEKGKLYRAAQSLGAALSEHDVVRAGVRAAREIASFDLAAVTVYDPVTKMHEVCAALSEGGQIEDLVGQTFKTNAGLVSMVVANRFPLPYRGDFDSSRQVVLSKRLPWPAYPSLLVLPLLHRERPLGTLLLGAKRRHAFGDTVRPTLEVLASHLAVSLANARMVHKLETMATTDGLTGLLNKRAMLEQAAQKLAAASRFKRTLAILVADIDFFKKVNDTHGHDVGDHVIRGLADILKRQKRATDIVARYGGEEFVMVCEQTDVTGAMQFAERVREELAKTVFRLASGTLSVTCSIGMATVPEAGTEWEPVFRAADEALYASKRGGRNRVTVWTPRPSAAARVERNAAAGA